MIMRLWGIVAVLAVALGRVAWAEPAVDIVIDGEFEDWAAVPSYFDALDDQHDTDHDQADDIPAYVDHPDVDLLEFKITHDDENFYAYFRARGAIGRTQAEGEGGRAGRYYAIVTIDVDNDDVTGYPLHEGGYYPTTTGYDMNFEVEFYNGTFNTGHYLLHACLDDDSFAQSQADQSQGIVRLIAGNYACYTQWVWWDEPPGLPEQIVLPDGQSSIVWVPDRGPVYQGIVIQARSADEREIEVKAPFRGFMRYEDGAPVVALGKTMDLSFSLEASGELAPGGMWASDTADPVVGYYLGEAGDRVEDANHDGAVDSVDIQAAINQALGQPAPGNGDTNRDGVTDATDIQRIINTVLAG